MLISKRSRKKSELFESRFRTGEGSDFPVRQYMRCREDFSSGLVHCALTLAFLIALGAFGRTLDQVFMSHGENVNPWYRWLALGLVGIFMLSVLRRLYLKVVDLREIRREMKQLRAVFRNRTEGPDEE